MLTNEEIERLEALLSEATPGPWRTAWDDESMHDDDGEEVLIAGPGDPFTTGFVVGNLWHDGPRAAGTRINTAAIAALRNAAPALLAAAKDANELRAAMTWKKTSGPMSALDVLGWDRDEWKRRALEAEDCEVKSRARAEALRAALSRLHACCVTGDLTGCADAMANAAAVLKGGA